MSRVANQPIEIPAGVDITLSDDFVTVKGSKGELKTANTPLVVINEKDKVLTFSVVDPEDVKSRQMSGTLRSLVANMVAGVSAGFEKKLQLIGVGYRAQAQGEKITLSLGYSHPIEYQAPEGITFETPSQTEVLVKGIDKQKVGQVASEIRGFRPPEPYKGKGVRYADEQVLRKEAKKK